MIKYILFILALSALIFGAVYAFASERPVFVLQNDLDAEMRRVVLDRLCDEPQPTERPALVYVRENGECVAEIRL